MQQGGRPGGHVPPHFLADQLTLSQPGGAQYPHPVLCAPPQIFDPCCMPGNIAFGLGQEIGVSVNPIQAISQDFISFYFIGNGYISTDVLKEILQELDAKLTNEDLDNIIEEVDEDGSGTLGIKALIIL